MPYLIRRGAGPRPYKIVRREDGKVVGTSKTRAKAEACVRARYMGENNPWLRRKKMVSAFVLFLSLTLAPSVPAAASPEAGNQLLSLPDGDAVEGRRVFQELKCFSCHRIAGDSEMTAPTSSKEGPVLGLKQARYKARFIADSVVFPSHAIAPGFKDGVSAPRMGDFSDTLTVKQLADVVAYLRQLDEEI